MIRPKSIAEDVQENDAKVRACDTEAEAREWLESYGITMLALLCVFDGTSFDPDASPADLVTRLLESYGSDGRWEPPLPRIAPTADVVTKIAEMYGAKGFARTGDRMTIAFATAHQGFTFANDVAAFDSYTWTVTLAVPVTDVRGAVTLIVDLVPDDTES